MEHSVLHFSNTMKKLKTQRKLTAFSVLKRHTDKKNFDSSSKKIFYKIAFASLYIAVMKINKNLQISAFNNMRNYEFLREDNSGYVGFGDFGLSKNVRKQIKKDVEHEYNQYGHFRRGRNLRKVFINKCNRLKNRSKMKSKKSKSKSRSKLNLRGSSKKNKSGYFSRKLNFGDKRKSKPMKRKLRKKSQKNMTSYKRNQSQNQSRMESSRKSQGSVNSCHKYVKIKKLRSRKRQAYYSSSNLFKHPMPKKKRTAVYSHKKSSQGMNSEQSLNQKSKDSRYFDKKRSSYISYIRARAKGSKKSESATSLGVSFNSRIRNRRVGVGLQQESCQKGLQFAKLNLLSVVKQREISESAAAAESDRFHNKKASNLGGGYRRSSQADLRENEEIGTPGLNFKDRSWSKGLLVNKMIGKKLNSVIKRKHFEEGVFGENNCSDEYIKVDDFKIERKHEFEYQDKFIMSESNLEIAGRVGKFGSSSSPKCDEIIQNRKLIFLNKFKAIKEKFDIA